MLELFSPVAGLSRVRVSSEFGARGAGFHDGIDVAVPVGTAVVSVASGVVVEVHVDHPLAGHSVWVDHGGVLSGASHLSAIAVSIGQPVENGQVLGRSGGVPGTPGAGASDGAHLHFALHLREPPGESWTARVPLDPLRHLLWGVPIELWRDGGWRGYLASPMPQRVG
jgi:murein DD-endopeptidase MepM/ murein hydrolase activator NlpD